MPGSYGYPDMSSPGDDYATGESSSVTDGLESVRRPPLGSGNADLSRSHTHRHYGARQTRNIVMDDLANKSLPPEHTDYMIQQLEKRADKRLRRTYANAIPLAEVIDSAKVLTVGLTFLPGADKPQVNRIEQMSMDGKEPDQRDASWRVDTAASLLSQFLVTEDLQIVQSDQTAAILMKARARPDDSDNSFQDQMKALSIRTGHTDVVTIDSARVTLVNDLRRGTWDLQGLLVEVDEASLWGLVMNYRTLIARGGPEMTFDETRTLLETMIEDARRLCIRSPILFRMSTRSHILNSKDTRYGNNHGPMFRTLTTSKGVREIISLSAAYYNSLDPNGSSDQTQSYIKPRFLQMLALLLSLLNNQDLAQIKDFLEATYKIKADRQDIELLILKVIPLLSINSRVFLRALVPAIEGFPLTSERDTANRDDRHSDQWNIFIMRLLFKGYILPGSIDQLGRDSLSWIVKWPEETGFHSTSVFNNLQYAGRLKGMNGIPPIEINPAAGCAELTVEMTDERKYVISSGDLEKITLMTPGTYPVQQADQRRHCYDLRIEETPLSDELYSAIKHVNQIINRLNIAVATPKRNSSVIGKLVRKAPMDRRFWDEYRATGRIAEVHAYLNESVLATAYKLEGRKITRFDGIQNMARTINALRAIITHIEHTENLADVSFFNSEKRELRQSLDNAKAQINLAEQSRMRMSIGTELSNEPIAKCIYPEGSNPGEPDIWNDYRAWAQGENGVLHIEGKQSTVAHVRWLTDELIELSLGQQSTKLVVTPLRKVPEGYRDDEVRVDDIAMLVGQYVIIGELDDSRPNAHGPLIMTNSLRVVSREAQNHSRRGMNRIQRNDSIVECCFR